MDFDAGLTRRMLAGDLALHPDRLKDAPFLDLAPLLWPGLEIVATAGLLGGVGLLGRFEDGTWVVTFLDTITVPEEPTGDVSDLTRWLRAHNDLNAQVRVAVDLIARSPVAEDIPGLIDEIVAGTRATISVHDHLFWAGCLRALTAAKTDEADGVALLSALGTFGPLDTVVRNVRVLVVGAEAGALLKQQVWRAAFPAGLPPVGATPVSAFARGVEEALRPVAGDLAVFTDDMWDTARNTPTAAFTQALGDLVDAEFDAWPGGPHVQPLDGAVPPRALLAAVRHPDLVHGDLVTLVEHLLPDWETFGHETVSEEAADWHLLVLRRGGRVAGLLVTVPVADRATTPLRDPWARVSPEDRFGLLAAAVQHSCTAVEADRLTVWLRDDAATQMSWSGQQRMTALVDRVTAGAPAAGA